TVTLFSDTASTVPLCAAADQPTATVAHGRFSLPLDATCAAAIRASANANVFVEVKVADQPVGARTQIGAVPFAVEAGRADTVATVTDWRPYPPVFATLSGSTTEVPVLPTSSYLAQ